MRAVSLFFIGLAALTSFGVYFGYTKAVQKNVSNPFGLEGLATVLIIVLSLLAAWLSWPRRD
jgi:Mn2+/Fe2+ NRAMP family transporter